MVPGELAGSAEEAAAIARKVGLPVALKICSAQITHKSDIGGVVLGLSSAAEVRAGYEKVRAAGEAVPGASIDGVLVTPMRSGGAELLAGVTMDPTFGPVLAVGLGGIWVEVLKDTSLRLLPVDAAEVKRMLGELRGRPLLAGARGTPPANLDAVAEAIAGLGQHRPLAERRAARAGSEPAVGERGSGRGARRPRGHRPIRNGARNMMLGVSAEQEELRASVRRFLADRAPLRPGPGAHGDRGRDGLGRLGAGGRPARPAGPGHPARLRRGRLHLRRAGDRARGVRRRAVRRPVPGQRRAGRHGAAGQPGRGRPA